MQGVTAGARPWGAALALLIGAGLPSGVAAADPSQVIPGATLSAVTGDVDGDGAREVVRLVDQPGAGFTVEAWDLDGQDWAMAGATELLPVMGDGSAPESPDGDIGVLLLWEVDGRERVMALTAVAGPEQFGDACCLAIFEVRAANAGIELVPLSGGGIPAQMVDAVDVDGDGIDELLVQSMTYGSSVEDGTFRLAVLRWDGSAFGIDREIEQDGPGFGVQTGDSDGVTGVDILIGPTSLGQIQRMAWADGGLQLEEAHLDLGERFDGWLAGVAAGAIVLQEPEGLRVVRWPRGAEPRISGRLEAFTFPSIGLVGDGPEGLVVTHDGFDFAGEAGPTTTVYDLDLRALGEVAVAPGTANLWRLLRTASQTGSFNLNRNIYPFVGPLPGPIDGRPGYAASGTLIQPDGANGFETREISPLIGVRPIGLAGEDDAWVALGDDIGGAGAAVYLYATGGQPFGSGRLVLTPFDALMRADGVAPSIELRGAVEVSRTMAEVTLLGAAEGFEAVVSAPPGSVVIVADGNVLEEHEIGAVPVVLEIEPRRNRGDRNVEFDRWVLVMTADGRGAMERWEGTFVREKPELVVSSETDAFSLSSTVRGRASSGATVTVDGRSAEFNAYGAFRTEVDAPIWPRDVLVVARDPIGNETVSRLQVVGFLDYRGLPWVPIIGLATLAAGAFLYVRTPRRRVEPRLGWGDATLEEIEGD